MQRRSRTSFAFPAVAYRTVPKHGPTGGKIRVHGGSFPAGGNHENDRKQWEPPSPSCQVDGTVSRRVRYT
jgi:hypothetical protein